MKQWQKLWKVLAIGAVKELRVTNDDAVPAKSDGMARDETEISISSFPQAIASSEKDHEETGTSQQLASATTVAVVTQTQEATTVSSSSLQATIQPLSVADSALFNGEVEIGVLPPVDTVQLTRLTRKLDDVSQLRILKINGYWDEGYIMTVLIDDPLPVIGLLKEIAEVEKAHLWTDEQKGSDGYFPGWIAIRPTPGGSKGNRLVIKLRRDPKF